MVIPGCETSSGRSRTDVLFTHILITFLGSFTSVSGVTVHEAGDGFWGSHA